MMFLTDRQADRQIEARYQLEAHVVSWYMSSLGTCHLLVVWCSISFLIAPICQFILPAKIGKILHGVTIYSWTCSYSRCIECY